MSRFSVNHVGGCPGWYYGLLISRRDESDLPVVRFDVYQYDGGAKIEGLEASAYRTTELARQMGDQERLGFEEVAQRAIGRSHELHSQ
jgi:hypothetical protein